MKIFSFCFKKVPHNFSSIVSCICTLDSKIVLVNETINQSVNAKSLLGIDTFNRNMQLNDTISFKAIGKNENKDIESIKKYMYSHFNITT